MRVLRLALTGLAAVALCGTVAAAGLILLGIRASAPEYPGAAGQIALWPPAAPGAVDGQQERDVSIFGRRLVYNVVRPSLIVYPADPARATGAAMIVAPGGGFMFLDIDNEGTEAARWLAAHGITAFVLKYRTRPMPADRYVFAFRALSDTRALLKPGPVPFVFDPGTATMPGVDARAAVEDGLAALKRVKAEARRWGYDSGRVGFMGFSAGAAVTYGVTFHSPAGEGPAVIAPLYVSLSPKVTIPDEAPPIFLAAAKDDPISQGMPATDRQWRAAGRPAELHMYASGGHGFGMARHGTPTDAWIGAFAAWLRRAGFIGRD